MTRSIDLNADIGEHDGKDYSRDTAILGVVSSANIACGKHAGSLEVMRRTVALAYERGVTIGAHPGYPDREGFGRRELDLPLDEIIDSFQRQIENMHACCDAEGARLRYVKPHGALYNRAAKEEKLASGLASCVWTLDNSLVVLALAGGMLERASGERGLRTAGEAFIDRGYMPDGTLVPRDRPGALVTDDKTAAERAVEIANGTVRDINGSVITLSAKSLCVHGDSDHALETVKSARAALEASGFTIESFA
ncbi:MAG TPA: 5-oxoprolinase subunit PxpA [Gemmatimonadaceae bacterium]